MPICASAWTATRLWRPRGKFMLTAEQWSSLVHLGPSDFQRPDGLQYGIVKALDQFISRIGSKPVILSDYRPGDPKEHGHGLAIDTTWPGQDALYIRSQAMNNWPNFTGVGLYINEQGAVSFHFDQRQDTIRRSAPDRWGGIITHPFDEATGAHKKIIDYVGMDVVVDLVKKNSIPVVIALGIIGAIAYLTRHT